MKKAAKITGIVAAALIIIYFAGPKVDPGDITRDLPKVPADLTALEKMIRQREATIPNLKADNQAVFVWNDSVPQVTEYSMVYLHGFSASRMEGNPIHRRLASRYGCNLYLPRITGHGLDEQEAMLNLTAEEMMASAAEAIAIGQQIGKKVILLTTSTGGTYALWLAGGHINIEALILYSPNVKIYDPNAFLLSRPWGLEMARLVKKSDYHQWPLDTPNVYYWTNKYRLEVLTQLQAMVEETMNEETFEDISQPVFMGYYYKDDTAQDNTVSVPAMLEMFDMLGTPDSLKRKVAFAEAGHHVIGSSLTSEAVDQVFLETTRFLEEVVGLKAINPDSLK